MNNIFQTDYFSHDIHNSSHPFLSRRGRGEDVEEELNCFGAVRMMCIVKSVSLSAKRVV